ncbi:MAG: ATP-binding protein [Cycloclasticus sp.]|nr:ATP-binding protein [Cycloclasticus sp.]
MGRLFWKIFFGFWLTLLITGAAVGTLVWKHNQERIEQLEVLVNSPRADMSVNAAANVLEKEGTLALKELLQRRRTRFNRPSSMFIINDDGVDLLGRPISDIMLRKAREALNNPQQSAIQQVVSPQGERFLLFIPRRDHPAMHQRNGFPMHLPLLPLLIMFIGSLLFSVGLAWYITRPILLLRQATNRFADGKLDTRVMPFIGARNDEITDLAKDFDHMAEQVQQLIASQKRLLNDVSHELRSPLARLQVAVEMSRQQPQKSNELMQRIEKESQRLNELVGELLTLSRLEADVGNHENDYFDINGLVESIANDARFEANSQEKQVNFKPSKEVLLNGSIELLRRAIENVIRNAVYYTPEISQVDISLEHEKNVVEINICDNGKGVSEAELPQLFQPFVRVNANEQNVKTPGYGLGLAIARRAVELHQGSISAHNRKKGGLCIKIRIPTGPVASKGYED